MPPTPILTHKQFIYILFFCLLTACTGGEQQRLQLKELERMNRADSLMLNDSLALALAQWFDRHGTPNEQLRAYYMLGRTYADCGETPQALEAYHDAIDRADTTSADCNYYTLCRVYSQMAEVFRQQNLFTDNLRCLDYSIRYAYRAGDTIAALNSYGQKAGSYDMMNIPDSVILYCMKTAESPILYNRYMALAANAYIKKGEISNARRCLDLYERGSGYFDCYGNIEKGREAYYNIKGRLYSLTGQIDSAEFYYRKILQQGHSPLFQDMAARSLSQLYNSKGISDSTAAYSLYAYEMNDSVYNQMSTNIVARMQAMYDYSNHQRIAQQEKERADIEKSRFWHLLVILVLSSIMVTFVIVRIIHSRKKIYAAYSAKIRELEIVQNDILRLRSSEEELQDLVLEKEKKFEQLQEEVASIRRNFKTKESEIEFRIKESPIFLELQKKANQGLVLNDEDWSKLSHLVIEMLPGFHQFVLSEQYRLGINEYRMLILLRLHIKPKPISNLLNCTPQNVTKLGKNILQKLYDAEGTCSELSNRILKIY